MPRYCSWCDKIIEYGQHECAKSTTPSIPSDSQFEGWMACWAWLTRATTNSAEISTSCKREPPSQAEHQGGEDLERLANDFCDKHRNRHGILPGNWTFQKLFADGYRASESRHQQQVAKLREGLRKAILWGECLSVRIETDRGSINWTYLNDARQALAEVGEK